MGEAMFQELPIAKNWGLGGPFHLCPPLVRWLDGIDDQPEKELRTLESWLRRNHASCRVTAQTEALELAWRTLDDLAETPDPVLAWRGLQSLGQALWSYRSPRGAVAITNELEGLLENESTEGFEFWCAHLVDLGQEAAAVWQDLYHDKALGSLVRRYNQALAEPELGPDLVVLLRATAPAVDTLLEIERGHERLAMEGSQGGMVPWLSHELEQLSESFDAVEANEVLKDLKRRWRWSGPGLLLPTEHRIERLAAVNRALNEQIINFDEHCAHLGELFEALQLEVLRPDGLDPCWVTPYELAMGLLLDTQPEVAVSECAAGIPAKAQSALEVFLAEGDPAVLWEMFQTQGRPTLSPWWCPFCHQGNRLDDERCGGCRLVRPTRLRAGSSPNKIPTKVLPAAEPPPPSSLLSEA